MRLRLHLKQTAEEKNFTISSLSKASFVGTGTIRRLWDNPEANVMMSTVEKLANALGTSPFDLFEVVSLEG